MRYLGPLAVAVLLSACASHGYRDHHVPALAAPVSEADDDTPVRLASEHTELLPGGIRLIRPEFARPAPAFELVDDRGRMHTPSSLRGRVVWLDLWAVWCGTCRAEFPFVQKLHDRFERNGLTILAVCRESDRSGYERATVKDWLTFRTVDANDDADFPFPVRAFPTSVLIDRAGRVRGYWQGHRSPEAMEDAVRTLLAEPPPAEDSIVADAAAVAEPAVPALPTSAGVLSVELTVPRKGIAAGGYFEGTVVVDVDPGWHLTADAGDGAIPLDVRFPSPEGFTSLGHAVPRPREVATSTGARRGHVGRFTVPVWGLVDETARRDAKLTLRLLAIVQACDRTQCLPPVEIPLTADLWIDGSATP